MLYYVPLEPYVERYTYFMSAPNGWAEDKFNKHNIDFVRIDGDTLGYTIKDGVVLDACGRSYYALSQISKLVSLINDGTITDDDTIYFEDFWHPGVESLFYIRQLKDMRFKMGAFIHAQSVDDTDFTWVMRDWMRPIEIGYGNQYDFIFTCSPILRQLCIVSGIAKDNNIFYVGLPYNSKRLLEQLNDIGFVQQQKDGSVIFASRFDDEKDPNFFLDVVESCPDIKFKLVNPRKNRPITSNVQVMQRLDAICDRKYNNLTIINTFDKLTYYTELSRSSVVFNCANQDWVSWTLLEAVTFGCNPLYPIWKDFVYELNGDPRYLYQKRNLEECCEKLRSLIDYSFDDRLLSIKNKHDDSWRRYLEIMGLIL